MLPLASSSDFAGLIIFVIVAILSALSKRIGKQTDQQTPPSTTRRVPPRTQRTPSPIGTPDLAAEMRRYLEDLQKKQGSVKSAQASPSPVRAPVKIQKQLEPPPLPIIEEKSHSREMLGGELFTGIQQEIQSTMRTLSDDVQITKGELTSRSQGQETTEVSRFDIAALRNPQSARQAVIFAEILGQPRAMTL